MNPRHGEVWLVDMGLAAKTRPAIVPIADNLNVPRLAFKSLSSFPPMRLCFLAALR